ncbi:MAG TPA: glycosyl hydrolase family 28 protein [Opitutaceae bacterium]|jgi:polygalacturonase|nr:glycosyl hydrolase family 28 protein [Opitutaceae bacterium]
MTCRNRIHLAALLLVSLASRDASAASLDYVDVSPAQPVIPQRVFQIDSFGATADGKTLNTGAFKRAMSAVEKAGGGMLVVPAGVYLTEAFDVCSGVNLHLDAGATILFSPRETLLDHDYELHPLLFGKNVHDVTISGAGTINGSGEAWWGEANESYRTRSPLAPRPLMVVFRNCQRIRVEGVTLTHSPTYNLTTDFCQDVSVVGITIYNPALDNAKDDGIDPLRVQQALVKEYAYDAHNTDGIDPGGCQRVLIDHCHIDTGDDCIAVSGGERKGTFTKDVLVTDCTFVHGHGCSIGSGTNGGVSNMRVRRCTFDGTKAGIHLKSARDRGGVVEHLDFSDLTMTNVGEAVLITSYYDQIDIHIYYRPYLKKFSIDLANGGHDKAQPVTDTTPYWRDITIRNVTATCIWEAGMVLGLPEAPADHITFEHVHIQAPEGFRINYANDVTLRDMVVRTERGPSLIVGDSVTGLKK